MSVTLRQLEVLVALAETEHVGDAADHLSMSSSATSASLAALESALGARLFDRVGRGIRLNGDGQRVRDAAVRVLAGVADLEGVLHTQRSGRLVVGTSTTIANAVLGPAVASFVVEHPAVSVEVAVGNTREVADLVVDRRVDVAFVEGVVVDEAVTASPWRTDRLVVFVGPDHPLAAEGRVTGQDLERTWVLREQGSGTRETFIEALGDEAARLGRVVEIGSSGGVAAVVRAGAGIGCLSELVVASDLAAGTLVELAPPPAWSLDRTLWQLTSAVGEVGSLGRAFLDHVGVPVSPAGRGG